MAKHTALYLPDADQVLAHHETVAGAYDAARAELADRRMSPKQSAAIMSHVRQVEFDDDTHEISKRGEIVPKQPPKPSSDSNTSRD